MIPDRCASIARQTPLIVYGIMGTSRQLAIGPEGSFARCSSDASLDVRYPLLWP